MKTADAPSDGGIGGIFPIQSHGAVFQENFP